MVPGSPLTFLCVRVSLPHFLVTPLPSPPLVSQGGCRKASGPRILILQPLLPFPFSQAPDIPSLDRLGHLVPYPPHGLQCPMVPSASSARGGRFPGRGSMAIGTAQMDEVCGTRAGDWGSWHSQFLLVSFYETRVASSLQLQISHQGESGKGRRSGGQGISRLL